MADEIIVLKPHGSISHTFPSCGGTEGSGLVMVVRGDGAWRFARDELELSECPGFPDLVPPGHTRFHLANYETNVVQAVRNSIGHADVLVTCGFSARGPDSDELHNYLQASDSKTIVAHVGLRSAADESNSAGKILRKHYSIYKFFDTTEVQQVPTWINRRLTTYKPNRT